MRDLKELCEQRDLRITQYFPNLETLLKDEHIPRKAKDIFTRMMKRTAKFTHLMNQKLDSGHRLTDADFWDNLDDEHIEQVKEDQIQPITDLGQLSEQYLEIIRLYSAVVIQHANPATVQTAPRLKMQAEARRVVDIVNLSGQPINLDELREKYKDEMWQPSVWD